jgi:hypothetical protein
MIAKPKRPSHSERLQAKLLAVLETHPGITTNGIQDALIKQGDSITDHRGHPIEHDKSACERIAQQLRTLRDKRQVFDRQDKGVTWWYPQAYRQGPKLNPTLGPSTPPAGWSVEPPQRSDALIPELRPGPVPAGWSIDSHLNPVPPIPSRLTYVIQLDPARAALTAQALFRLASLLAADIAVLLHPLVEMLNYQTEDEQP